MPLSNIVRATALASLTLLLWTAPSRADDHYGAIAYSTDTGKYGYSYDYGSRGDAEQRALNECGESGCSVVLWFRNACGALATADDHSYGTAWATSRGEAENTAMSYCNKYSSRCSIARWVCTSR